MNAQLAQFVSEGRFEVSLVPRPEKVREWGEDERGDGSPSRTI